MKSGRALLKSGITVVLMSMLTVSQAMASGEACKAIFPAKEATQDHIDKIIKDLASLRVKLDEAKASGQSSVATTALESDYLRKEREIFEALVKGKIMSQKELGDRLRQEIAKIQEQTGESRIENEKRQHEDEKKKKEQRNEIQEPFNIAKNKMTFHDIKPGKFKMGEAQIETEITHPFAMMSTQVTQMMWARLMIAMGEKDLDKINPSKFKAGADGITVSIEGIDVEMQPDHPVESVSHTDIQDFILGLNKLSSKGDAETEKLLKVIIPGHQRGDIYDFPTEAQWEFVMRNRGHADKKYFDSDELNDIGKYAWFQFNSNEKTHAVASLQPRMIDGKPFYDLEGNVFEWIKDWYADKLEGGTDPQGAISGFTRVIRGGSWFEIVFQVGSSYRRSFSPSIRNGELGFRLVRMKGGSL